MTNINSDLCREVDASDRLEEFWQIDVKAAMEAGMSLGDAADLADEKEDMRLSQ